MKKIQAPLIATGMICILLLAGCQNNGTKQSTISDVTNFEIPTTLNTNGTGTLNPNTNQPSGSVNSSNSTQPTSIPTVQPKSNVSGITITSSGFQPAILTIAAGTKVVFVNLDTAPHWPASNPHPTHTDCPGFDALRALQKNQSYSFTFDKAETCQYHDHLNTSWTGKIIVQ